MKRTNKLFSVIMIVALALSLAVPAFAAETTYTLTLNRAQAGHTYTAYQIFAGDVTSVEGDKTLSNIVWGSGVTADGQTALGNAADKAEALKDASAAEAFAAEVAPYLDTDAPAGSVTIADGATSGEITGLKAGYYLIKTTGVPGTGAVYTYYIMKIVKDTEATIKADVPKVEKTVEDNKNDVSIGDTVTFILTATMPSNLEGYETYQLVFHDTMSAGLTFAGNDKVKVTVAGVDKTEGFTVDHNTTTNKLTISCDNVLALGATTGSKIVVTYDATLNEKAEIGVDGNPNKVYLEYSNNPNGTGTGNTVEDEVKVYTWEIPVFKYTGTDTPLAGAGFTLYTDVDCTTAVNLTRVGTTNVYKVDPAGTVTEIVTEVNSDSANDGKFQIEGLAQGTYYLKETTTPAGYNTAGVTTVVIGENGALTQNDAATAEVSIQNNSGTVMPETGGIGTTIFYICGGLMVLTAVVVLVSKRRMSIAE